MTVLLTGATGFIGSHILKVLLNEGYEMIILKRSSSDTLRIDENLSKVTSYNSDKTALSKIFSNHQIDLVIHAATSTSSDNTKILECNINDSVELFGLAMKGGVFFVNLDSTSYHYKSNNYANSKKIFRDIILNLGFKRVVNLPIELVYGAKENPKRFLPTQITTLLNNKPISMTQGIQKRNIIHIDDLVNALVIIISNKESFVEGYHEIYLASNDTLSIKELMLKLKELTASKSVISFGEIVYEGEDMNDTVTNNQILQKLGWRQNRELANGLRAKIEEMRMA